MPFRILQSAFRILMRTPSGADCKFYYADFNRGRSLQECRLPRRNDAAARWSPDLCKSCPAPRLLLANACPHLTLSGQISKGFLGFNRKMTVAASCSQIGGLVAEPAIGCGHCHEADSAFKFPLG